MGKNVKNLMLRGKNIFIKNPANGAFLVAQEYKFIFHMRREFLIWKEEENLAHLQ